MPAAPAVPPDRFLPAAGAARPQKPEHNPAIILSPPGREAKPYRMSAASQAHPATCISLSAPGAPRGTTTRPYPSLPA